MAHSSLNNVKIGLIIGSLRRNSLNLMMARALLQLKPPEFDFTFIEIGNLPLYNQDDDGTPSETVRRFKEAVASCGAFLFVTPEYNRSVPGVLKNALDHGSRPHGQSVWAKKPAGLLGASPGAMGTSMAQQHLRNILAYLDVPALCQPEAYLQVKDDMFDKDGELTDADTKTFLAGWMDHYVAWVMQQAGQENS